MPRFDKLLVLDLDETLIHATPNQLDREPDFKAYDYVVYKRPGVEEFIATCLEWFTVGVWTTSGEWYAHAVVKELFGEAEKLAFLWSSVRSSRSYSYNFEGIVTHKDIKKLTRIGYDRERIIMVDDSPEVLGRNYGNGVIVSPYEGDENDNELPLLLKYLETLGEVPNVRAVEKRGWRSRMGREH